MADRPDIVLVLTTLPIDGGAADTLARTLVERRLAACVSVLAPMQSTYRWKNAVEQATERQVLIKTTAPCLPELKSALAELHPYEVPELLVLGVTDGAEAYVRWIAESVG